MTTSDSRRDDATAGDETRRRAVLRRTLRIGAFLGTVALVVWAGSRVDWVALWASLRELDIAVWSLAVVVAENRNQAEDATEAITLDIEALPAVTDCAAAAAQAARVLDG